MAEEDIAATKKKKKIMVVSGSKATAERLKMELEYRKVCDVVDIFAKPKESIEYLALNKGDKEEEGLYSLFIVDEGIDYPAPPAPPATPISAVPTLAKHREDDIEIERAKRLAESKITIRKNLEGMGFYQFCKQLREIRPDARIVLLTETYNMAAQMKAHQNKKQDFTTWSGFYGVPDYAKWEYAYMTAIEEFGFDIRYIRKHIKSYNHVVSKLNQLLVTGGYRREKFYADLEQKRKAESRKAYKEILSNITPAFGFRGFRFGLNVYGQDVTDAVYAIDIVDRLRKYEKEAMQEVEEIRKFIRVFEDRFPSIVQDPAAFEVEEEEEQEEEQEG